MAERKRISIITALVLLLSMVLVLLPATVARADATAFIVVDERYGKTYEFTRAELETIAKDEGGRVYNYSTVNTWPSFKLYTAMSGPTLAGILSEAGIPDVSSEQQINLISKKDDYNKTFNYGWLTTTRYNYPNITELIGLVGGGKRVYTDNLLTDSCLAGAHTVPVIIDLSSAGEERMVFGQRYITEQTNDYWVNYIVNESSPGMLTIKNETVGQYTAVTSASYGSGATVPAGTRITLTLPDTDANTYYTTDGTTPTLKSKLYNYQAQRWGGEIDPPVITGDTTLKVKVIDAGARDSEVSTFTYKATNVIKATGVSLDRSTLSVSAGGLGTLTATISPANASNKNVVWTSSNPSVASVAGGMVIGKAAGTTTVTARTEDGGYTADCTVTVSASTVSVTGVSLDKHELALDVGASALLTATVAPSGATNRSVYWASGSNAVATVENGVVMALAAGETTVTVRTADGGYTDVCTVRVTQPVTGIALDAEKLSLNIGETHTLTATVAPENATDKAVIWSSLNDEVATVADGKVTAVAQGTTYITAAAHGGAFSARCRVTVEEAVVRVTGVSLDRSELALIEGEAFTLAATVMPENATNKNVKWVTSDRAIATVENGVVTALSAGTATIRAITADGLFSAGCVVTVSKPIVKVSGVTLDKTTAELIIGDTLTLTATVAPENATDKSVAWTSGDEVTVTVDANGVVTAIAAGTATITATTADGGFTATCAITVKNPAPVIPNGWQKIDDKWYYGENGAYLTGLREVEGYKRGNKTGLNTYFFDETGAVQTGFFSAKQLGKTGADWYFFCEAGSGPSSSVYGQMLKNHYVESPSQGYISPSERKVIESGKKRIYRYYFDPDGKLFTGWYNNNFSYDQQGCWRYFIETGSSPISSRLGRMCRYGQLSCIGNNGETHLYYFSQTGGMFRGKNGLGTFTKLTGNPSPASTLNGAKES